MRFNHLKLVLLIALLSVIAGCTNSEEPPNAIVKVNDEKIEAEKGTYQWETGSFLGKKIINADAASPFEIAKGMKSIIVPKGSIANIEFGDDSEPEIKAYLWEKERQDQELTIKQTSLTLPSQQGKYVIEILAKWSNGDASYTFLVEIK
ncbi:hypothetical protein [Neobacillus sp. LXY-4]|uniref:hypothetical protein n=1 Tax=Neobacillus sp. LXY-4 TaxID=3379826 RepID=UPI003EE39ADC